MLHRHTAKQAQLVAHQLPTIVPSVLEDELLSLSSEHDAKPIAIRASSIQKFNFLIIVIVLVSYSLQGYKEANENANNLQFSEREYLRP